MDTGNTMAQLEKVFFYCKTLIFVTNEPEPVSHICKYGFFEYLAVVTIKTYYLSPNYAHIHCLTSINV